MNDRRSPSRLDAMEKTAHEFFTRLGKLNQEELDESGTVSRISIYQRCPLITDPETFHELSGIAEEEDAPRGILNLMGFIGEHGCLPPFINADEEISHQLGRSILRIGEEEVPYAVSEQWLMRQKDRGMREAIEDERGKTLKKMVPLIKQAHVEARRRCIDLGFADMNEMWRSLRGIDFEELKAKGEEMLSETQDIFSDQMQWLARRRAGLRINELKRHDVLYIFSANEYDRMFPYTAPRELLNRTLNEAGIPFEEMESLTLMERGATGEPQAPFCLPLDAPSVVLYGSSGGGRNYYFHLFQELGRALFHANVNPHLPFRLRCIGDPVFPRVFAFLFGALPGNRLWLKRHLGIENESDLMREVYIEKLYSARAQVGRLIYELEALSQESPGESSIFRDAMHHATGVDYPDERHLTDIPPWFKNATNLLAWNLEAGLRRLLVEEYDQDWFRNPGAGEFLKSIWAEGYSINLEDTASQWGIDLTDMTPLTEDFHHQLA